MVEIELPTLSGQCLDCRIGEWGSWLLGSVPGKKREIEQKLQFGGNLPKENAFQDSTFVKTDEKIKILDGNKRDYSHKKMKSKTRLSAALTFLPGQKKHH